MHPADQPPTPGPRRLASGTRGPSRMRAVAAATALLVLCGAPFAGARTGDDLREGVRNGTTSSETEIIADIRTSAGAKGGFAMRMSNLSSTGGGFVNGCRASAAAASKPCYRASNLSDGRAFEFNSSKGPVVGEITAGAGGDAKKPFTTNATGVATGLNADRVDSLNAAEIIAAARTKTGLDADTLDGKDSTAFLGKTDKAADADTLDGADSAAFVKKTEILWALADLDSGGASIIRSNGATGATRVGVGDFTVTFNRDISACVIQATPADATGTTPPNDASSPPGYWLTVDHGAGGTVQLVAIDDTGALVDPASTDGATVTVFC